MIQRLEEQGIAGIVFDEMEKSHLPNKRLWCIIYLEVVGMKFPIALSIIIYFEIAFTLGGGMLFLLMIVYVLYDTEI